MKPSPAIADYDAKAAMLVTAWRKLDLLQVHAPVLHLMPERPSRILDIGAGAGGDAGWYASLGHAVLAVEPADGLRLAGMSDHPGPNIEWLDDSLPDLVHVMARGETFDLVTLTAVWAHLDHGQRAIAIPNIAVLMRNGARLIMSVRNGWTLPERPTWEARPEDTIRLAEAAGLQLIFETTTESIQTLNKSNGVTWTWLAFEKRSRG
ncbi:MAG TPA: methyltransferase domain-containing protein [Hyphomonadaceae bacterium]|nr:methyltransferase domain-containing protein [Hyphomonadaceae bacterium]